MPLTQNARENSVLDRSLCFYSSNTRKAFSRPTEALSFQGKKPIDFYTTLQYRQGMTEPIPQYNLSVRPFSWEFSGVTAQHKKAFLKWSRHYERLVLEVGCGNGFHPIDLAKKQPNTGIIAVERTKSKGNSLRQRLKNHPHLKNIFPIIGEAANWLPGLITQDSLAHIYLLYPNPYPKESQRNKRWHCSSFFHFLLYALKKGGWIELRTNEDWLYKESKQTFKKDWKLSLSCDQPLRGPQSFYASAFEKKYLTRGEECFRLVFQKRTP